MSITQNSETKLIEKIRNLPPDKITLLEDFIDFLLMRTEDRLFIYAGNKLSEPAFAKIWDNPEDAEYDEL